MYKRSDKGFSLAELLIVVAIIAVLTAVSIPLFNFQLERSREAVDLSNLRVALEEVSKACLDPSILKKSEEADPYVDVIYKDEGYERWVKVTQKTPKWQNYGDADVAVFAENSVYAPNVGENAYWIVRLEDQDQVFVINKSS